MHVVEQLHVPPDRLANRGEQARHPAQVRTLVERLEHGEVDLGRLVEEVAATDAVRGQQSGKARLHAHGLVPGGDVAGGGLDRRFDRRPVGVPVHGDAVAGPAAEQVVHGRVEALALDVPEGHVDGADRRHRHRSAPPVRPLVEEVPDVLDPLRVEADEQRQHVVVEVADHGQLPAVQRRVADAAHAVVGLDHDGDEVAPGARDDGSSRCDLHPSVVPQRLSVPDISAPRGPSGPASRPPPPGARPSTCPRVSSWRAPRGRHRTPRPTSRALPPRRP